MMIVDDDTYERLRRVIGFPIRRHQRCIITTAGFSLRSTCRAEEAVVPARVLRDSRPAWIENYSVLLREWHDADKRVGSHRP
jgi:DNA recombination-dependent growth factor C